MGFSEAVAEWIAARLMPRGVITEPKIENMEEAGACGELTCWWDDEVELSFRYDGRRMRMKTTIPPGQFVEEVAAIWRSPVHAR